MIQCFAIAGVLGEDQEGAAGQEGIKDSEARAEQAGSPMRSMPQGKRSFSNGQEASEAAAIFRQVSAPYAAQLTISQMQR